MLRKLAAKLLLALDDLSHFLAQYTVIVGSQTMTFMVFRSVLSELFKRNKYIEVISAILSLISTPAWADIGKKLDEDYLNGESTLRELGCYFFS